MIEKLKKFAVDLKESKVKEDDKYDFNIYFYEFSEKSITYAFVDDEMAELFKAEFNKCEYVKRAKLYFVDVTGVPIAMVIALIK